MKHHLTTAVHIAEIQLGVVARRQLRRAGLDHRVVGRLVAGGHFEALSPRVLRRTGGAAPPMQAVRAATLDLGDDARASHTTAAAMWGLPGFLLDPIHVVQEGRAERRSSLVGRMHSVRSLPANWCTTFQSVPAVRPELMLLQLCGSVSPQRAERAVDSAWAMRLVSGRSLIALLASYGEMGRNGSGVLRAFMDERGPDYAPPESNLEARFMSVIGRHGLPPMRRQVNSGGETWTGRVDFRAEHLPFVVEVQSERYHSALLDTASDARRKAQLELEGFVVVEVTDTMLWSRPEEAVALVRGGLDQAASQRAALR